MPDKKDKFAQYKPMTDISCESGIAALEGMGNPVSAKFNLQEGMWWGARAENDDARVIDKALMTPTNHSNISFSLALKAFFREAKKLGYEATVEPGDVPGDVAVTISSRSPAP